MMLYAKLSTAITIAFGPVLDADGAEYTGAVVAEVKISKNNGTPAALNGSATLTHKEVGIYELVLTASDISAVGQATLTLSKTTYVAPPVTLVVLPAKVYDSIVGGTDNLEIDVIQWLGTAASTPTVAGIPNVNVKTWNDLTTVALPLVPTTPGRTLDVAATGEAGLDFNNVLSSSLITLHSLTVTNTTTLSGAVSLGSTLGVTGTTTLAALTTTGTVTLNALTVSNATTLTGAVTAANASNNIVGIAVSSLAADSITNTALATSAVTEIQSGLATSSALAAVAVFIDTEVAAILALLDDPRTEPGQGAPPVNPDMATKIDYLYKAWRNKKLQTATQYSLYADDTTTIDAKATVSSNGTTVTVEEVVSGP